LNVKPRFFKFDFFLKFDFDEELLNRFEVFGRALIAMLLVGESACFDFFDVRSDSFFDNRGQVGVFFHEFRFELGLQAKKIGCDEYLAVARRACPDADGRDTELFGDPGRKILRHAFEHNREDTCLFQF